MSGSKNTEDSTKGHIHPLSHVISDAVRIFDSLGFSVARGPEMESEWYNFDALNVPKDHPSRDMQDTFYIKGRKETVLRTHTSPVQVRYLEEHKNDLPIRIIVPGKVFRNEATDATHEAQFFQIEGLMIGPDVTLAHLKGVLQEFFSRFFGSKSTVRLRPSFFPFVEPGLEVDVSCFTCGGSGCAMCKQTGYIEIMGAGMVHPNVLLSAGIDPRVARGFAFGGGVDRLAMLKYGVPDVRLFYGGDMRVTSQF